MQGQICRQILYCQMWWLDNMIYYLMGKSASGKDTLYKKIMEKCPYLKKINMFTTRPKRENEIDGREYNFVDEDFLDKNKDKIIEKRVYNTVYGPWVYATLDLGDIDKKENYLMIGTLESYKKMKEYFGDKYIVPLYIEVPYEIRLERAINRDKSEQKSMIEEIKRRLNQDEIDFSEENVLASNITKRYNNIDSDTCYKELIQVIERTKC